MQPPSFTPGEPPPLISPDPTDPSSPLSPVNFSPLPNLSKPSTRSSSFRRSFSAARQTAVVSGPQDPSTTTNEAQTDFVNSTGENQKSATTVQETGCKASTLNSAPEPKSVDPNPQNPSILLPKSSTPILTSTAAGPSHSVTLSPPLLLQLKHCYRLSLKAHHPPKIPTSVSNSHTHKPPPSLSLVERLRVSEYKILKRLAPVYVSENGRPRIIIPDEVFHKGAEIHKDFIICYFNGKSPPFSQIQSIFNYMWGKCKML